MQLFARTTSVLFPVPDFTAVIDYGDTLTALGVQVEGLLAVVDLETGSLTIGDERYDVAHPGAALRPIYYKQMVAETGQPTRCEFVALGWQATVNGANVRFGVKLFPDEGRWLLGEGL
jgi:hypothetical protein